MFKGLTVLATTTLSIAVILSGLASHTAFLEHLGLESSSEIYREYAKDSDYEDCVSDPRKCPG